MKNTKINTIILIAMSILGIAGAVFLGISFFADNDSTLSLRIALTCVDIAAEEPYELKALLHHLVGKSLDNESLTGTRRAIQEE